MAFIQPGLLYLWFFVKFHVTRQIINKINTPYSLDIIYDLSTDFFKERYSLKQIMKYRRLSKEELAEVEKEFINFLVANTITGDDWIKIKEETPEKAESLIDLFSDIVFEKVLKKVEFLEFKSPKDIKTFNCLEDKIKLMGIQIAGESDLNFSQNTNPQEMLALLKNSDAKLQLYQAEKPYNKEREVELFEMMEQGCLISKGDLFRTLEGLK